MEFSEAMRVAAETNIGKWPRVHQSRGLWVCHFLWDWDWISELLTFVRRQDRQHGRHGRGAVMAEFTGFSFAWSACEMGVSKWADWWDYRRCVPWDSCCKWDASVDKAMPRWPGFNPKSPHSWRREWTCTFKINECSELSLEPVLSWKIIKAGQCFMFCSLQYRPTPATAIFSVYCKLFKYDYGCKIILNFNVYLLKILFLFRYWSLQWVLPRATSVQRCYLSSHIRWSWKG